jgi:hypothetical protein
MSLIEPGLYTLEEIDLGDIPAEAVFIIGAGHFGSRAAGLLSKKSNGPLFAVDREEESLARLTAFSVRGIVSDGIDFLLRHYGSLKPVHTIVPAVPVHLAFEWLIRHLGGGLSIKRLPVPEAIESCVPHTWQGSEGSLLVSYADFLCPDDCPEPVRCTVTGERRSKAMHELLRDLKAPGFEVHVIRSHQLAPGLGGYRVSHLTDAAKTVSLHGRGKWLLGTACKCHGILTAMEIQEDRPEE